MKTVVIWISGLLGCGTFGAIVSNWIVFPNYGEVVSMWGFIAGALLFALFRLGFAASQRTKTTGDERT
jgi:hypothetical protein